MQRPMKLPTGTKRQKLENKALWNDSRSSENADFFTIGYEGKPTKQFLDELESAGIKTLLDIRFTPISMYRPELSKSNLRDLLKERGIYYFHIPEWGVPKDIRVKAIETGTRETIWAWYKVYIVERLFRGNLHWFLNIEHPAAMMCVEADPTECHRHLLFNALEEEGLRGFDL